MKRTTIIGISIVVYLICGIGLYFATNVCLDKKQKRLRTEAHNNFSNFFEKQNKFVSVVYSGEEVYYEQIKVPNYNLYDTIFHQFVQRDQWEETYGDIYKLYKLTPRYTNHLYTGWLLHVVEYVSYDCYRTYQLYPYQVGYRKQEYSWAYNYMPDVQDAVNNAFDFWTTNEKSEYSNCLSKTDEYDINKAIENEYYYCFSYEQLVRWYGEEGADSVMRNTDWEKFNEDRFYHKAQNHKSDGGYMYNGYYKVFNYMIPRAYYQIQYKFFEDPKSADKKKFLTWGYMILSFLLLAIIVPLSLIEIRKRKERKMPLKQKLLQACNPSRFMKPYDEQKVSIANDLYEQITKVSAKNITKLKVLRKEAANSLGISFIDEELLKELVSLSNPERYTKPYNSEKVKIANQLYTRLTSKGLDIDDVENIQKEIQEKLL